MVKESLSEEILFKLKSEGNKKSVPSKVVGEEHSRQVKLYVQRPCGACIPGVL